MIFFQKLKTFYNEKIKERVTTELVMLLLSALCAASLLLQYFSRPDAVSFTTIVGAVVVPFQNGVNEIGHYLFASEQEKLSLQEAQERIEELEKENEQLKTQIWNLSALDLENIELRKLLTAKERYKDYEMTEAQIIGNSGTNAFCRFTINKGSVDGLQVNMNVVNEDGLIGIISQVGLNYSIVTTIIEDNVSVSSMTKYGNDNCIVTGAVTKEGYDRLLLNNVSLSVDFSKDQTLVTSNISDKYLPNIPVGTVQNMKANEDALTQSGYVKPAVDFTSLNHVLVVTTMLEIKKEK